MGVHYQLGQSEDLTAEMESVAETGLLTFFGRQSLHRLQVKVVVQVKVVQVFPGDKRMSSRASEFLRMLCIMIAFFFLFSHL